MKKNEKHNKTSFEQFMHLAMVIVYRKEILILTIIVIALAVIIHRGVDKSFQKQGYSGALDNFVYDKWTGELLNKGQEEVQNEYTIISNGKKISSSVLEEFINEYKSIQGNYMFIKEENVSKIRNICSRIFGEEYFDTDFSIDETTGRLIQN